YFVVRPWMVLSGGLAALTMTAGLATVDFGRLAEMGRSMIETPVTHDGSVDTALLRGHQAADPQGQLLIQKRIDELLLRQEQLTERSNILAPLSARARQLQT